ncbi:hypothetical protein COCON_G00122340 [Conger conger]|uniref:Myb/SANT-like DNA-binding domain-containing protein n=1 Tax=Conger conger TaxID=82655 RepID=A0A9Q1DH27_CONCO|nr:hypothetical protein COCON_G00122340 [Conger conger]
MQKQRTMAAFVDCNREKTHWSSYEAQVLLTLWADSSVQQELESTVRNERVYSRITSELAAVGIHRSIKQCREKIKKLKQQYKKLKDQDRKTDAEWYVTMDSVLGHRPTANFECDVTYYSPDTAMENESTRACEAQFGSDRALFGSLPSMQNGHKRTVHQAMKRWNNQRRRILMKAKQTALRRLAFQGRNCPSLTASTRWESNARRESHALPLIKDEMGIQRQSAGTDSYEENTGEKRHIIKIEAKESFDGQQRTGTAQIPLEPDCMRFEESQAHSTMQQAAVMAVQQQDLLAAQQEQCRLMAENNSIQQRLVRAVSRSNRCMSELAKSIRVQSAAAASGQDRIVQLLERQEWTNQLLTMKSLRWCAALDSGGNPSNAVCLGGFYHPKRTRVVCEERKEDSALTGDEPIVEVQILGEEQPIMQEMHEEIPPSHTPPVSRANQAVKRKRAPCSSDEWKKIIVDSDQQYVGALHRMLESESQHRREELQMKRDEMELRRADARLMKDEASASSAVQGQLVSVLGQITELFRAKQAARTHLPQGGDGQSSASQTTRREVPSLRELHTRLQSDAEPGAAPHRTAAAEAHEENRSRETRNIIKTEMEEPIVVQQRTDTAPINLETVPLQYEESQAHSTTQEAAAITVQQDLLAAQQEQCRLMAENNSIQQRLVRAVSRSNRCMSELAKSIRVQSAAAASVQDRIVQLLERQEWTNQLLTMKGTLSC